jgi:phosphonate transport system substrate-binding protein
MAGGDAIAAKLSEMTGYTITVTVPTNYAALIEAMGSGNAQIGWLPPAAYIVAHAKGYADVGMVTLRNGADHYAFQYVANVDAGFTSYYDAEGGRNTAGAEQALAQFAGKKPCWTDPLSASGYLVPAGYLANLGISTKAGAWVQGHPTVIQSVYFSPKGEICDFGATYVDARSSIAKNFPDVNDKVAVIWVSDARIPNDTVAYSVDVPADMRANLTAAMIEIASTPEGLQLLKDGGYSIGGLKAVEDAFFDDFRVYLQSINFDFNNYK